MQIHGPFEVISGSERISAHLNPGAGEPFAVVAIGSITLYLYTQEECDWLIRAATDAKAMLTAAPEGSDQ